MAPTKIPQRRRGPIPLTCDRATQTETNPSAISDDRWLDPFYMGSSRESTPPPARCQASQNKPKPKPQHSRKHSGLGQVNVVNTISSQDDAHLDQDTDERPLKKRRVNGSEDEQSEWVRHELNSIKESLDTIAVEAREDRGEMFNVLHDIILEIRQLGA